jgi:aminoglycoside phosphotransferase (APT) family kinase protein
MTDDLEAFRLQLQAACVIRCADAVLLPLSGGVSSDIYRLEDSGRVLVVKRALPKLKVADDWFADVSRNRFEQAYLERVGRFLPNAVPKIVFADPDAGWFAMEWLEGFSNWKALLMEGACDPATARLAARILGTIHRVTWNDPELRAEFETTENFRQLRVDPYLITSADRTADPVLAGAIREESRRLTATRLCLVHGDYSPKNLLVRGDRLVVLDCEVAWFGDPAFDIAFLLNHLLLKALRFDARRDDYAALAQTAWREYGDALGGIQVDNVAPLLAMLMLARVDGKSPAEYLCDHAKRQTIREFVAETVLIRKTADPAELIIDWTRWIGDRFGHS